MVIIDLTELCIIVIYHPQKAVNNREVLMQENLPLTSTHFLPGMRLRVEKDKQIYYRYVIACQVFPLLRKLVL